MRVVSICGSQRKNGNTEVVLKDLEKRLSILEIPDYKHKYYNIAEMNIYPCRACHKCKRNGNCIIEDDFSKPALKAIVSDLIIIGTPVYFSDVSAQIKAFFDRTYSILHSKRLKGKDVILVATSTKSETSHALNSMKLWASDHEMNILSMIDGISERKGRILENERTAEAIISTVATIQSRFPKTE